MTCRVVRNWMDPSDRRRAALVLRDTLLDGVPIADLEEIVRMPAARLDEILSGRTAPTIDELHALVRHGRFARSEMLRDLRLVDDLLDDEALDRLAMSDC
jgi:hypothetical protein